MALTLFLRDDCALCDQAVEMLAAARAGEFSSVYIDADSELEAEFGDRVPVLRDLALRELAWPFDVDSLTGWLSAPRGNAST